MIVIHLGDWIIDPPTRTISHGLKSSGVSPKAMAVLQALLAADGGVVSRQDLLDAGWPKVTVGEEVLTQAVAELRRAFEQCSGRPAPLRTVYKGGYQLTEAAHPPGGGPSDTEALSAFAPYLAARCLSELYGSENNHDAIRLYREALAGDPGFSGAHSGLALRLVCCRFCYGGDPATLDHALEHARLAIRLDRTAAEPYLAQGHTLSAMGDWNGAVTSFKAALRLDPNLAYTYELLGIVLFRGGAFEAASAACDRAAMLLPEDSCALLRSARARRAMGDEAGSATRVGKARARTERRLEEEPDDLRAKCQRFSCLVEQGEKDAALKWAAPLYGTPDSVTNTMVGSLAKAGEVGLALDQLEAAVEGGWSDRWSLSHDPDVDVLRGEARFERIAAHLR